MKTVKDLAEAIAALAGSVSDALAVFAAVKVDRDAQAAAVINLSNQLATVTAERDAAVAAASTVVPPDFDPLFASIDSTFQLVQSIVR